MPEIIAPDGSNNPSGSGFLTKLTPAGDGIAFSTFIPGRGITSLTIDDATHTLLFSGDIAPGAFPIATVTAPVASINYQSVVRMPLDGSSVASSVLLAPGSQSVVAPAPDGAIWTALPLTTPVLPLDAIPGMGNTAAFRITAQNQIDRSTRLGGTGSFFAPGAATNIASIAVDDTGRPIFAGSVSTNTPSNQLATLTFDLPLLNTPTEALPSTLRDAVPPVGSNCGSLCTGTAGYLAGLSLTSGPALALSTDTSPNLVLRNLGSATATGLQISASGFTLTHDCPAQLAPSAECNLVLSGGGPGTVTVQADGVSSQTIALPATAAPSAPLGYSPHEIDLGVLTPSTAPVTRTITVTNLSQSPQIVPRPFVSFGNTSVTINTTGDCPLVAPIQTPLAPGASCHLIVTGSVPQGATGGAAFSSSFSSGNTSLVLTALVQVDGLSLSSSAVSFGTQFLNGLRLPRYLYLSNHTSAAIQHTPVALPSSSPFTVADACPTLLGPHTVCQLRIDYLSPVPSSDAVTLTLDQGKSIEVTGRTIPQPGADGSSVNPNLSVTPTTLDFPNAVVVTGISSEIHTVAVSNTGTQPFPLSLSLTGDFADDTNCGSTLAGGASCSVIIYFTPSQPGTNQGLLAVSSGSGSTPVYVNLSGTSTGILDANNGTLDLGSTPVGQPIVAWYKITQPLSQLTASVTGAFGVVLVEDIGYGHGQASPSAFAPSATGTCLNCWLGIQFLSSAAGPQSTSLSLATASGGAPYPLTLTGTAVPLSGLLLTPSQQDFGPITLHSTSASTIFTLTNLTASTINLDNRALTPGFAVSDTVTGGPVCLASLDPGASCFLPIVFAPTSTGQHSGTLTFTSSAITATAALSGFGAPDPGLSLSPTALVFRNVPDDSATVQSITLTNTGLYSLQIGTPSSDSSSFQPATTCSSLAPGASCSTTVTFAPTNATTTATLSIPVTSSAPGGPQTTDSVPLSGAYTTEDTGLQILPSEADFGPAPVGAATPARRILVNNLSSKTVTLALSMPRQFVLTDPPCVTLAPGAGCSFSVAFLPITNGAITGTVLVQATPTDGGAPFSGLGYLKGFGKGTGVLTVTGDLSPGRVVDFHQVPSGQTATRPLTMTNTGTGPLTIRRVTSEWPFLSSTTCGTTLAVNASCAVTLTYSPLNQVTTGGITSPFNTDNGSLVLESDAETAPDIIDLTGTVTPSEVTVPSNAVPIASFTLSQGSLTFPLAAGNASEPRTVTLLNTGTRVLHIARLTTAPEFAVTGSCGLLVPGDSCNLQVALTQQAAQSTVPVIGSLEIASDSSTSLEFVSLFAMTTTAPPPALTISPRTLDFGFVPVGGSATLPVQITNTSQSPTTLTSITATGDYTTAGDCPSASSQLVNSSCTLQVTFRPTQAGTRTGTLTIASTDPGSPTIISLTGNGVPSTPSQPADFTLTVDGGSSSTATLKSGQTASYHLIVTPLNEYTGTILLSCAPVQAAQYASCSLLPASVQINSAGQTSTVTLSTAGSAQASLSPRNYIGGVSRGFETALCLLPLGTFGTAFLRRRHRLLSIVLIACATAFVSGCGGSASVSSRSEQPPPPGQNSTPPGTYQYQVTATSAAGQPISHAVTLNLTVTAP